MGAPIAFQKWFIIVSKFLDFPFPYLSLITQENNVISNPPHGNRSETAKTSGNGEDAHDAHKRKDVFRPSMFDLEGGRRDRWRDEERDTKSSIRKDR